MSDLPDDTPVSIDHAFATELWDLWAPPGDENLLAHAAFERMMRYAVDLEDDGLYFRPGGWKVDLVAAAARVVCASAVLASLFHLADLEDVDREVVIATAGIASATGVTRVRPDRKQQGIADRIREEGLDGQSLTAKQAHQALGKRLRREVTRDEVANALDALVQAGYADREGDNRWIVRAPGDEAWIRFTLGDSA